MLATLPILLSPTGATAATLTPADREAFLAYAKQAEEALQRRAVSSPTVGFPAQPTPAGDVKVFSEAADNPSRVGSSFLHDWTGRAFLPGATAQGLMAVLKDYPRHKEYYAPEVIDSRLLSANGPELRSFLRLRKKKVLTVILDAEYQNWFVEVNPTTGYSLSHSTSIREVEQPGEADERVLPDGQGQGFLWRLHAYWLWKQTPAGVWAECRAISLSRDVPSAVAWMVSPIIRSLPRESLEATLRNTGKALRHSGNALRHSGNALRHSGNALRHSGNTARAAR
jgi:hypothetical protein